MNPLHPASLLAMVTLAGLALRGTASAGEEPSGNPAPAMVEIEAQFFHATDDQVRSVLKQQSLPDPKPQPGNICPSLLGLLGNKEAETVMRLLREAGADFFSSPRLITKSGQQAAVEAVRELNYPTSFQANPKTGRVIPSEFQMRKVGVTVKIEPVVGPEEIIDINVEPSLVSFLGFIDYGSPAKPITDGTTQDQLTQSLEAPLTAGSVWQPIFATSKITTSASLWSGQTILLGGMLEYTLPPAKPGQDPRERKSVPSKRLTYVTITARVIHN